MNSNSRSLPVSENLVNSKCNWLHGFMVYAIWILISVAASAQADFEKGYQAFQSYHGTDFDTVNLANGNLVLNIPLLSYEQRGGLPPVVIAIRSNSTTFQSDPPFSNGPADTKQNEVASGVLGSPAGQPHVMISPGGLTWKEQRITLGKETLSRFVAIDDSGATHSLGENIANKSAPYFGNIRYSIDDSDFMLTASSKPLIIDQKGNIGGLIDPNGNAITLHGPCSKPAGAGQFFDASLAPWESYSYGTASATYIIDSVGRTIPNPSYITPVNTYSCIVDVDKPYYPANTTFNDPACPPEQTGTNGQATATAAASDSYSFPSQNGTTVELKFCYQKISVHAALPNVAHKTTTINETWPVLTAAILPNGTEWVFTYDQWGQVFSVAMPTGATTSYAYGGSTNGMRLACGNPPGEIPVSGTPTWPFNNLMSSRMVTQRTLAIKNPDGSTSTEQWNYASTIGSGWGFASNSGRVTVTDLMGNDVVHTFSLIGTPTYGQPICGPYETNVAYYQGSSRSTFPILLKQVATTYTSVGTDHANPTNFSNYIALGVLPSTVTTSIFDGSGNAQVQQDTYNYDTFGSYQDYKGTTYNFTLGQKLGETESDWGAGVPGAILRTSLYTNQWQSNWKYYAANLINLPCLDTILTGTYTGTQPSCTAPTPPTNQASQTSYFYDEATYVPASVIGAQTTATRWLKTGTSPSSHTFYNAQAMPIERLDPLGNPTFIAYDTTGLYPNKITHPQTGTVVHIEIPSYDDSTGELLSHTDENQNKTSFQYDTVRRLINTKYPDGGSETFQYNDTIPPSYVFSKILNSSGSTFIETGLADSLGRKKQSQINSDSEGVIYADTVYDSLGRVASQSNPYRSTGDSTYRLTSFSYDALGRKVAQSQPDGTLQQWCYQNVSSTGQTNCNLQLAKTGTKASNGNYVDFQDESGNDWQRNSDGLGRLASIMEPNGASATPSMQTTYTYDVLGDLTKVVQSGNGTDSPRANRTFTYDALSRLVTAVNPERGTNSYTYDLNSNMLSHTQPMVNATSGTQTIRYCYDALNRRTAEYTGSLVANCPSKITAANLIALYTYDITGLGTTPNYPIGHLTDEIEYTAGTAAWERSPYQYDTMGRLLDEQQCAFGSCTTPYTFTYGYNYAGNVLSTTNGLTSVSPITIGYSYDNVARLATVSSVTPTTGIWSGTGFPATLYTAKEYGPVGLLSATYGSSGSKPMFLSRVYDDRLRVTNNTVSSASTQATGTITLTCSGGGTACTPTVGVSASIGNIVATTSAAATINALAANLASAINATDGMLATATANTNVVTITAIEYGTDGELSLIAAAAGNVVATASGATLSGDTSTTPYQYTLTYTPNSNVASVVDTVMGNWTYGYDTLNRVTSATASTAGIVLPSGTYKTQCWAYDSFGNRTGEGEMTAATACPNPITNANHSSFATYNTSNQITANSTTASFVYDVAGNITNDGINKYVYDLDGRICAATTVATGGAITQYVYDAEGRRVAKGALATFPAAGSVCAAPTSANGFTASAMYLRGEHGDQDTELNGSGVWQHTNVFAAGGLTATYDTGTKATLSFNFPDWLGSKRLQSNFNGATQNSWASDPFGAYLRAKGSGADATEHHFTGKERDAETGNDYFGARYYESGLGRFISPDWSGMAAPVPYAVFGNPQSLNLYGYIGNAPLVHIDIDGHCWPMQACYDAMSKSLDRWTTNVQNKSIKSGPTVAFLKTFGAGVVADTIKMVASPITMGTATGTCMGGNGCSAGRTALAVGGDVLKGASIALPAYSAGTKLAAALGSASTEETLSALATKAAQTVGRGKGAVYGTKVHSTFADLVEGAGDSDLSTEISYKGGKVVDYGTPGSIRADVVEGPIDNPTAIYDLKTGSAKLTPGRIAQMQKELPGGSNVPVQEIRPQQ